MKMMAVSAIAQSGAVMSDILEASDWLYSFFSNISYHLESSRWGNRFPVLLCEFCDLGVVEYDHLDKLERELDAAYSGLARIPVEDAIYDIKNPAAPIPWETLPEAENAGIRLCEPWLTARTDDSFFDVFRKKILFAKAQHSRLFLHAFMLEDVHALNSAPPQPRPHSYWEMQDLKALRLHQTAVTALRRFCTAYACAPRCGVRFCFYPPLHYTCAAGRLVVKY